MVSTARIAAAAAAQIAFAVWLAGSLTDNKLQTRAYLSKFKHKFDRSGFKTLLPSWAYCARVLNRL